MTTLINEDLEGLSKDEVIRKVKAQIAEDRSSGMDISPKLEQGIIDSYLRYMQLV